MKVRTLNFPTMEILCVGDDKSIVDISQFFNLQSGNNGVCLDILLDRIIAHGIYACAIGNKIKSKYDGKRFNEKLREASLLISEDDYLEAMFCCYPDKMAKELQINEEQKKSILENSIWKEKDFFDL